MEGWRTSPRTPSWGGGRQCTGARQGPRRCRGECIHRCDAVPGEGFAGGSRQVSLKNRTRGQGGAGLAVLRYTGVCTTLMGPARVRVITLVNENSLFLHYSADGARVAVVR